MTKKTLSSLLIILVCVACGKISQNGDLDGRWQMTDLYQRSQPEAVFDIHHPKKAERLYWDFQLDLLCMRSYESLINGHTSETTARFTHSGDHFAITDTYIHFRDRDSLLSETTTALESYGIHGNRAQFRVARLNSSSLILVNATDSLVFRKF